MVLDEGDIEAVSAVVLDVSALEELDRLLVESSLLRDSEEQTVLQAVDEKGHGRLVAERALGSTVIARAGLLGSGGGDGDGGSGVVDGSLGAGHC